MGITRSLTADRRTRSRSKHGTAAKAFWAAQARRFDEALAHCHGPFLAAAAIRDGDRVLDVGCGNGQATRDAARTATNGFALGVDLSLQMI